ncbi:GNAT family N-acetyltransferase [Deefgea sp. CFH1-16]|uniref:GNAT family N-acetyltransferase n=1 Tax=Deefgea sp. CFH1-16 TaxID=2675457 RepID=UPI0015F4A7CA|nr:GNAT family N-acetyltransferase [Deefgea sp. CFH1-16]MBM5575352.1 GNAT family N-acetyltransferase [Deefgea sp. CFH1-16]
MEIRRFQVGDEIALFRVFLSAVHEVASRDYTQEQIQAWAPVDIDLKLWANHIQALQPFVATIDNAIVGYADIQANGYIDHFYVSGNHTRKGIGTFLMNRIHEEAMLLNVSELTSDVSKTAEPFFVFHGFHVKQRKCPVCRGVMLQNALMLKEIITC